MSRLDLLPSGFGIVTGLTRAWDHNRGSSVSSLLAHGSKVDWVPFWSLYWMLMLVSFLVSEVFFFFLLQTTWDVDVVKMNKPKMATEKGWVALLFRDKQIKCYMQTHTVMKAVMCVLVSVWKLLCHNHLFSLSPWELTSTLLDVILLLYYSAFSLSVHPCLPPLFIFWLHCLCLKESMFVQQSR